MNTLLDWIDQRTGLCTAGRDWFQRPLAGGPAWRLVWPSTLVFAFVTQVITGFAIWMYYTPGAQTAWESVYYLQSQVQGGWLLRAMHHYTAQVMLVLVGIYMIQMIVRGAYRAPRECLYWTVVLMGLMVLALNLTGDLLPWDQNGFWSTRVRTGFLMLLPAFGGELFKLAAGGPAFGHLTLARFVALHVGVLSGILLILLSLHAWLARRHGIEATDDGRPSSPYWPGQALRDAIACVAVFVVVLGLSFRHGLDGPEVGVGLGAPANPAEAYAAARPEWSFRGLFEFAHTFPAWLEILPIFVLPGILVATVLLMPFLARNRLGQWFNVGFTGLLLMGLAILSFISYGRDANDEKYQKALAADRDDAFRAQELARSPQGIPVSGALTLLRNDPKTQGPKLFQQHCASCHDYVNPVDPEDIANIRAEKSSAPNLYGYASRKWIAGLLDPQQIRGPQYFGNTKLKNGEMPGFVKETLSGLDAKEKQELQKVAMAISAEAKLTAQQQQDADDAKDIEQGKKLVIDDFNCVNCHRFQKKGQLGDAPDLTGYGSRPWIVGIISSPADKRFYGKRNDRMPAYAESATDPAKNILSLRDIELVTDWLRGEWYEE